MTKQDREKEKEAAIISPLLAAGSGCALGVGLTPFYEASSIPASAYFRGGLAGGLFFLGVYSAMRTFYQDDELGRCLCVASCGASVSSSFKADIQFCEKQKVFLKPDSWPRVARAGIAGCLVSLGLYGGLRTLLFSNKADYGAHRRRND